MPGRRVGALLGGLDLAAEPGRHARQVVHVGGDAGLLHLGQHADQRQLDVPQQRPGAALGQVLVQRVGQLPGRHRAHGQRGGRGVRVLVLPGQLQRELPARRTAASRSSRWVYRSARSARSNERWPGSAR